MRIFVGCFSITDNLPVATPYKGKDDTEQYDNGYLLGMQTENGVHLHNHLEFTIRYHFHEGQYRVVGFEVLPKRYSECHCYLKLVILCHVLFAHTYIQFQLSQQRTAD